MTVRIVQPVPTQSSVAVKIPTVIFDDEESISKLVASSLPPILTSPTNVAVEINLD